MDAINIYLIVIGVVLILLYLSRLSQLLSRSTFLALKCFLLRYLIFPTLFKPNRWIELTRFEAIAITAYLAFNITLLCIATTSLYTTTATLACINIVFTFLGKRINPLADLLGLSIPIYYILHRLTGRLAVLYGVLHSILSLTRHQTSSIEQSISGYVAAGSLLIIFITTLWHSPKYFVKIIPRVHAALGTICLASLLWHILLSSALRPKILALTAGSVFLLGITYRLIRVTFFSTGALVTSCQSDEQMVQVKVHTSQPLSVTPGCYFYVFLPGSLMRYSFLRSYPLTATWQKDRQGISRNTSGLSFLIDTSKQSRKTWGLSKGQRVLLDGPYRDNFAPESYDIVVLVAEGRGIAAVLPLIINLAARRAYDKSDREKDFLFRDQTRHVDLFWWLEDNHQDRWVQDQLLQLKSLDPENRFIVVWLLYPKPRVRTDELPFKANGHWRFVYDYTGTGKEDVMEKFREAVTHEALAPGRRVIVTSGSVEFVKTHREFAIEKSRNNLDIEFVIAKDVDIYMQGSTSAIATGDPERQTTKHV